jgi:hypothetical protein
VAAEQLKDVKKFNQNVKRLKTEKRVFVEKKKLIHGTLHFQVSLSQFYLS